jgi:hypothetical protein
MRSDITARNGRSPIGLVFAALLTLMALIAIAGLNSGNGQDHSVVATLASIAVAGDHIL